MTEFPGPSITVRPGTIDDVEVIARFNEALARESEGKRLDPATVRSGVRTGLEDARRARYFVAEIDGELVGQLMLTMEWSDWRNGDIWWLQSVYVTPSHRRRGVFRRLFEHVRDVAAGDARVVGLRLYVETSNRTAQATYRDLGMADGGYFVMERLVRGDIEPFDG